MLQLVCIKKYIKVISYVCWISWDMNDSWRAAITNASHIPYIYVCTKDVLIISKQKEIYAGNFCKTRRTG